MKILGLIFIVVLFSCNQTNKQSTIIDYLGQKPPIDTAEVFAKGMISTSSLEHSAPVFSPDGKTVLWSIMKMPGYHMIILEMNYDIDKWSSPHTPLFSDTLANEVYPSFSPDGKQLYFSSDRIDSKNDTNTIGNRLWKVERNGKDWGVPVLLDTIISKGGEYACSISETGNLYFTYGAHRSPDWNILRSENDNGKYGSPVKLELNSPGYEDGPFVAADESYLIFESDRPGSMGGSIDLFISFKNKDGQWSEPKNMGDKVNSPSHERFARVSPDGKYLFFGSNKNQTEKEPGFDIFWIDAKIIKELRKNNYPGNSF